MDYKEFLSIHGVMPWQYPLDPKPDYVWQVQGINCKYVGWFESKEIAHSWIQHHNDGQAWIRDNLGVVHPDFITDYQLVEIPRPRCLSTDEISANIEHVLTVMELQGEFD